MTDYERELMANGTYLIKKSEIGIIGIEENKLCLTCQNPYTEPETKDNMEKKN